MGTGDGRLEDVWPGCDVSIRMAFGDDDNKGFDGEYGQGDGTDLKMGSQRLELWLGAETR